MNTPEPISPPSIPDGAFEEEESYQEEHRTRRRRSRSSRKTYGRLWLLGIYVAFLGKELMLLLTTPASSAVLSGLITDLLWTTVLVGAMWQRRIWARYAYMLLMLLRTVLIMIMVPELMKFVPNSPTIVTLTLCGVIDAGIAAVLIMVPSVRHLTNRSYE